MEISAKHLKTNEFEINISFVSFDLSLDSIKALNNVVSARLSSADSNELDEQDRKISAYRALNDKMAKVDNRIMQKLLVQMTASQQVTMARLSTNQVLYEKILGNLSKQNQRQFEEDFKHLDKISYHQAIVNMEQVLPMIKKAAKEQKELQAEIDRERRGL